MEPAERGRTGTQIYQRVNFRTRNMHTGGIRMIINQTCMFLLVAYAGFLVGNRESPEDYRGVAAELDTTLRSPLL